MQDITNKKLPVKKRVPANAYRLRGKNLFLTFPQSGDVSKAEALEAILKKETKEKLQWVVVAQEQHKDGENHLHIGIMFRSRFQTRKSDYFDYITGKHGNYQPMKAVKKCLAYIQKSDKEPECYGIDLKEYFTKAGKGIFAEVARRVQEGESVDAIDNFAPEFVLNNKRKLDDYVNFQKAKKQRLVPKAKWKGVVEEEGDAQEIAIWLNANLGKKRPFKQEQLFITGKRNLGKTSLVEKLGTYFRIYEIPISEDFYDFYDDDAYDIAVLDEFKGQKTVQWLNTFLQGNMMTLRKKGSQILKLKNIPTIILSNYTLAECYNKITAERLETLQCRLKCVEVSEFIDLTYVDEMSEEEVVPTTFVPMEEDSPGLSELWKDSEQARRDVTFVWNTESANKENERIGKLRCEEELEEDVEDSPTFARERARHTEAMNEDARGIILKYRPDYSETEADEIVHGRYGNREEQAKENLKKREQGK